MWIRLSRSERMQPSSGPTFFRRTPDIYVGLAFPLRADAAVVGGKHERCLRRPSSGASTSAVFVDLFFRHTDTAVGISGATAPVELLPLHTRRPKRKRQTSNLPVPVLIRSEDACGESLANPYSLPLVGATPESLAVPELDPDEPTVCREEGEGEGEVEGEGKGEAG